MGGYLLTWLGLESSTETFRVFGTCFKAFWCERPEPSRIVPKVCPFVRNYFDRKGNSFYICDEEMVE